MHDTTDLYSTILAQPDHRKEVILQVEGNARILYASIESASVYGGLFQAVSVGNATARQFDAAIWQPAVTIPKMARVELFVRLVSADGTQVSEEVPKGVFYVDTRETDYQTGVVTIHAFDRILLMYSGYMLTENNADSWPMAADAVMSEIAARIGVEIDGRTTISASMSVTQPPADATMGKVAGWIAGAHGGNWTITDAGKLYLCPLAGTTGTVSADAGRSVEELHVSPDDPWSRVELYDGDSTLDEAGDDTGRTLQIECPFAAAGMAASILASVRNKIYRPYTATHGIIDPALEIGDIVKVCEIDCLICTMDTELDGLCAVNFSAPAEEELAHEFPQLDPLTQVQKQISDIIEAIDQQGTDIGDITDNLDGLSEDLDNITLDLDGLGASVDSITLDYDETVGPEGTIEDIVLTVDGEERGRAKFKIDGNITISGQLSAEALYAAYGTIADLTVNRLRTSVRIAKYLAGDDSDDHYLDIHGETIQFISGTFVGDYDDQAQDPYGLDLYWEDDPDGEDVYLGTNGFPYRSDGTQIFTTTDPAIGGSWPVRVYRYNDLVKAEFKFTAEVSSEGGDIQTPTIILGSGNADGTNIARIVKATDGFWIMFQPNDDAETGDPRDEIGIHMTLDGKLKLYGYDDGLKVQLLSDESELPVDHATQNVIYVIPDEE